MHTPIVPLAALCPSTAARSISAAAGCLLMFALSSAPAATRAADAAQPFVGHWALTLPGGAAGWLGVSEKDGHLEASLLWGGGSVLPAGSAKVEGDQLMIVRARPVPRKVDPSKTAKAAKAAKPGNSELVTARVSGDTIKLTQTVTNPAGKTVSQAEFTGQRIPPPPAAPDLSKVKFGPAIVLLNGKDLSGWKLVNPEQPSGWSVQEGILINRPVQEEGKPHKRYGNLRTEQEFEDFNLTLETRVGPEGNSGVYLRGIYEVQVFDSYGKPLDPHNMGAVYSRICPTTAAEKPAGQWQTMDITLVERHVTVILNGTKIIDNQPLLGCTGGALWSDEFRPGPLFLQGDHTGIEYRNIVLRPVVR